MPTRSDWSKKLGDIIGDVTQNFDLAFAAERLSEDERAAGMGSNQSEETQNQLATT